MSVLSRFGSYPASRKLLVLEAGFLCIVCKIMIVILPFRWTQQLLGLQSYTPNSANTEGYQEEYAPISRTIFQTIDAISRHVFWTNTCLVRSLTLKLMLRRRRINALLYLGVAKENNGQLKAHAWVKVPPTNMVYDDGSQEFTTVAVFK